jgi:hypothetical protein
MCGDPGEQRARRLLVEGACEPVRRFQRAQAEPGHEQRVARYADRAQHLVDEQRQVVGRDVDESPPRPGVDAEPPCRRIGVAEHREGALLVEDVHQRDVGRGPAKTVRRQVELGESGRHPAQRMHSRAHVVDDAGLEEFGAARPAPEGLSGLEHQHAAPGARQHCRGGQSVGPRTDHDGVPPAGVGALRRLHGATIARCRIGHYCECNS